MTKAVRNSASAMITAFGGAVRGAERGAQQRQHHHDPREAGHHHEDRRRQRQHRDQRDELDHAFGQARALAEIDADVLRAVQDCRPAAAGARRTGRCAQGGRLRKVFCRTAEQAGHFFFEAARRVRRLPGGLRRRRRGCGAGAAGAFGAGVAAFRTAAAQPAAPLAVARRGLVMRSAPAGAGGARRDGRCGGGCWLRRAATGGALQRSFGRRRAGGRGGAARWFGAAVAAGAARGGQRRVRTRPAGRRGGAAAARRGRTSGFWRERRRPGVSAGSGRSRSRRGGAIRGGGAARCGDQGWRFDAAAAGRAATRL